MWPTPQTLELLLLGLLPVAYCAWFALRFGWAELHSLRTVGVISLWVGYQLSPWLALGTGGEWPSFLLVPEYIDEGLLFSTLCMVCYLAGYTFTEKRAKVPRWSRLAQPALLPRVNYKLLLCLSLLSVVLFIILVGGPGEVWEGSRARGEGQFDARDLAGKFRQMANVLQFALDFSLACVAAVFILRRGLSLPMRMLGYGCLVVSALPSVFSFSRGVGMPFVVLGFLALRLRKRSG